MEFPDNQLGEIKQDWTRLELAPNHQSDSTMIHGKRLKSGESSWDGMPISESLTNTPGKGKSSLLMGNSPKSLNSMISSTPKSFHIIIGSTRFP
jgi:hypothetical protein